MTQTTRFEFPKLDFELTEGHYCCGHAVVCNIDPIYLAGYDMKGNRKYLGHNTYEAMVTAFFKEIENKLTIDTVEYNDRNDDYGDDRVDCCYAFITMTLYRGQHVYGGKDLIDSCLENGWNILQEGVNPKTGNRIFNLGRYP